MKRPTITLVTPSYNQAAFLEQTLRSVIDQRYPALEYIVIDGGSSDGSVDILKAFADHLAYWVSEPDEGQADAINKGFARASGDILGWLNSDDILLPGTLQAVADLFTEYPEIVWVTSWGANIGEQGERLAVRRSPGALRSLIARGWYHGRMLGFIRQESTFWRRELWQRVGGSVNTQLHYGMDYELWRRFAQHADLVTAQTVFGAYRVHPAQKTARMEDYYREIGVRLPHAVRLATLPLRVLLLLAAPLLPRLHYDRLRGVWTFQKGVFFKSGIW
jgi:glycosyltransferase involved in cell wall biosynthesis